jgi:hypothetical protein
LDTRVPGGNARETRHLLVDALVVAIAEPGGTVLTADPDDFEALAAFSEGVAIEPVWALHGG